MATRAELYEKFGWTAEAAQLFETDLGTIVLGAEGLRNDWHTKPDPSTALAFYMKIGRLTLGSLLRQTRSLVTFDDEMITIFEAGLEARNLLTHGFFERHGDKIQTDEGRDSMIVDLESLHEKLFNAWQIAQAVSSAMLSKMSEAQSKRAPEAP
jgi:hypothetical protein